MAALSTEALMARRKLAEQATPGPWKQTVILYDDEAGRYYDCVDIAGSMIRLAVYWTGNSKMWGGKSVYEMKDANAVHIAANDPTTVIATIDELLRLREQVEALTKHPGSPTPGETMNELDKLEKYLRNQDLFNSLEALRGLRAKCARLEREANWLAGSLPIGAHGSCDDARKRWRDVARKAVEESNGPVL